MNLTLPDSWIRTDTTAAVLVSTVLGVHLVKADSKLRQGHALTLVGAYSKASVSHSSTASYDVSAREHPEVWPCILAL